MSHLNLDGFEKVSGWFNEATLTLFSSEIDSYVKNINHTSFIEFNQEVSKSLLEKNKSQVRNLYINNVNKEAFFIKQDGNYKLINLMDPHNYLKSAFDILSNRHLNSYISNLNANYKFKNSILFFKNKSDKNIIDWHRDSGLDENKKLIVGIYLEDSEKGIDAVSYIPGSHLKPDVVIDSASAIEVEAKRGDAIIHYGSVFHMSPEYKKDKIRRTLYLKYNLVN